MLHVLDVKKWWDFEFPHGMIYFLWVLRCFWLSVMNPQMHLCSASTA